MLNTERDDTASPAETRISLRLATSADAELLAEAARRFFVDTFGAANRPEDMEVYLARAFSEASQRAELLAPDSRIWLAMDHRNSVVGYVHVRLGAPPPSDASIRSGRPAEIARLYAERGWHGRGLGAMLMKAAIGIAREWNADVLWLGVWERNDRAIAFYEKHGLRIVGAQEFMLGSDRQRDHLMARDLTSEV
jgi:GNAT superfamily N-acetyltransferase